MASYEYICETTGERRTIIASMNNPPRVKFTTGRPGQRRRWVRVWGDVQGFVGRRGSGPNVKGRKIPNIAPTLPENASPYREISRGGTTVREHDDGTFSDHQGHRIVEDRADMQRKCAQLGYVYEPED